MRQKNNESDDFGKDVFPLMLKKELPVYACEIKGYVQDIGTPERYAKAQKDVKVGKVWRHVVFHLNMQHSVL